MNIKLIAASEADDILCKDGEIFNSDFFFGSTEPSEDNSSGGDSNDASIAGSVSHAGALFTPPPSAEFLCIHIPPLGGGAVKAIILNPTGALAYADSEKGTSWHTLHAGPLAGVKRVRGVGDYLVVLTESEILYALYENDTYRWIGASPEPPDMTVSTLPKAIPPYSYTDGEMPALSVGVSLKGETEREVLDWLAGYSADLAASSRETIIGAVRDKFKEFVTALEGSGLYFGPVSVFGCYRLADGTLYNGTSPVLINPAPAVISLKITSASFSAETLYMQLAISRSPFALSIKSIDGIAAIYTPMPYDFAPDFISAPVGLDDRGRGFTVGSRAVSSVPPELPADVLPDLSTYGVPDEICSVGGRLLSIYAQGAGRTANSIATSLVGMPMAVRGIGEVAGGRLMHLTHSLRSISTAGFGDFPLYAFGSDGVRALSPSDGTFRDVQMLSRHVALGADAFAPAPGATFFLTATGVMKIEGTGITKLAEPAAFPIDAGCRLLYSYDTNSLLLFRPGVQDARLYDLTTGQWTEVHSEVASFHYGWPETWVLAGGGIGRFAFSESAAASVTMTAAEGAPVPVKTRPIKLGDPFALKKLREIEAVWPDGSLLPVKLYGALRPDKWYFLGCAPKGRMRLRGSGWRFYRVETFAVRGAGGYLLPLLRFEIP